MDEAFVKMLNTVMNVTRKPAKFSTTKSLTYLLNDLITGRHGDFYWSVIAALKKIEKERLDRNDVGRAADELADANDLREKSLLASLDRLTNSFRWVPGIVSSALLKRESVWCSQDLSFDLHLLPFC